MREYEETLKMQKISNGDTSFYIYSHGDVIVDYVALKECAIFLESLFRGAVPFIGQVVLRPDKLAMRYYTGVYKPRYEDWDAFRRNDIDCLIMNERCYKLLGDQIIDFEWFKLLHFQKMHEERNLYLFQCDVSNVQISVDAIDEGDDHVVQQETE